MLRQLFTTTLANEGVLFGVLNALAVSGTSSPVSVASGAAVVYGYPYTNDASTTVAIATPTTATRIDRIVLRASWAAQTVRITRIAGTEGSGSAPAMTQTAGTTWDIPLATVSITTGGVITVTDARVYAKTPAAYGWFNQALSVAGNVSASASSPGGTVQLVAQNTSNTANSAARALITVAGSSAADPYVLYDISGVTDWIEGVDNSDSDKFKISASAALGTNDALTIDSSLNATFGGSVTAATTIDAGGNITATKSASGANVDVKATNGSNTASSNARLVASVAGASAADPVTLYDVNGVTNWISGIDNSDGDKFKIASSAALGTSDRLTIDSSGNVTVGGTVTVGALGGTGVVDATQLASNAVTTAKIADANVTDAKIASGVDASKLTTGTLPAARIGASSIDATALASSAVTTAKIANDAVDDTKIGQRVLGLVSRQGGDSSSWAVAGTSGYSSINPRAQAGVISTTVSAATNASVSVSFPTFFSAAPIMLVTAQTTNAYVFATATASGATITINAPFYSGTFSVQWLAIGPE